MRTLVIGRSSFADVVIADGSVAPHHAEVVITDDGRFYLTDCGTDTGTWRRPGTAASDPQDGWQPVRQAFVGADEPLRLGDYRCTLGELVKSARRRETAAGPDPDQDGDRTTTHRPGLRGRLERDPATGEIVRRRP